jgi:thymidine phosphorylase
MTWIKLTQMREKERKALYINTEQIVRVMESIGTAKEYATTIALTNGSQDVCETIGEVMDKIDPKPKE